jgi:hypothetical protein
MYLLLYYIYAFIVHVQYVFSTILSRSLARSGGGGVAEVVEINYLKNSSLVQLYSTTLSWKMKLLHIREDAGELENGS